MELVRYFAYGSNMNLERMRERGVNYISRKRGILRGWRLAFNKIAGNNSNGGYANIVKDESAMVEGVLYEIDERGIKNLDIYEGCPEHYDRQLLPIQTEEGPVEAFVYIANPDKIKEGLKPKKEYLHHLIKGSYILSEGYRRKLASIEILD